MARKQDNPQSDSLCQSGIVAELSLSKLEFDADGTLTGWVGLDGIHRRTLLYEVGTLHSGLRFVQQMDAHAYRLLLNRIPKGRALDEYDYFCGESWRPRRLVC